MRYLNLFAVYLRLGAMNELQYRVNFFVELVNSVLALGTGLAGLALVFYHTEALGGWSEAELIVVTGVYTVIGGLVRVIIQPNMLRLLENIHEGTLDYTLTKPEDVQFMVSLTQIQIWKATDLLLGMIVIAAGVIRLGESVGALDALAFAAMIVAGGVMVYSLWIILSTTAFWFIHIWALLDLLEQISQAGRWPVGLYPGFLRIVLTFLVPVAFAVTVPSEALTGRLTTPTLLIAAAVAVIMLAVSRLFFRYGLRHYGGASA